MLWLQWRFCYWLPNTCKATIWLHIFSEGLKYATEIKQIRLEKSQNKTWKAGKNKKKPSGSELKGISHFNKQAVITSITEQRNRKPKCADNQVRNVLVGCQSNWLKIFRKQDIPPRAVNPYLDPYPPTPLPISDLSREQSSPSFFLVASVPFFGMCPLVLLVTACPTNATPPSFRLR